MLMRFGMLARRQWTAARPKMVAELEQAGVLEDALYQAQERTADLLSDLIEKGVPYEMALERAVWTELYLSDEDEVKDLAVDRMPYL